MGPRRGVTTLIVFTLLSCAGPPRLCAQTTVWLTLDRQPHRRTRARCSRRT